MHSTLYHTDTNEGSRGPTPLTDSVHITAYSS